MTPRLIIGPIGRADGRKVRAIGRYEQIGLAHEPARSARQQRLHARSDVDRPAFIGSSRERGFPLPGNRVSLRLCDKPETKE